MSTGRSKMANLAIQRMIYKCVQKPLFNKGLNDLGRFINAAGIRYSTGLTRNKAVLFISQDPSEIEQARASLMEAGNRRSFWAIEDARRYSSDLPSRSVLETVWHNLLGLGPQDLPSTAEDIIREVKNYRGTELPLDTASQLLAAGFVGTQAVVLIRRIDRIIRFDCSYYKYRPDNYLLNAMKNISIVLPIARRSGLRSEQTSHLLSLIARSSGYRTGESLELLPSVLVSSSQAGLSAVHIVDLIERTAKRFWSTYCQDAIGSLPGVIRAADAVGLDPETIHSILKEIIRVSPRNDPTIFFYLEELFKYFRQEVGLESDKIPGLIEEIIISSGKGTFYALDALPGILWEAHNEYGIDDPILAYRSFIKRSSDK